MARPSKIWFRKQTGWWMVQIGTRQVKLVKGRENRPEAQKKFHELMASRTEAPDSPTARVCDVVEAFLRWSQIHLSPETHAQHRHYGQKLSEECGFLLASEIRPHHITTWCDRKLLAGDWNQTTEYNAKRSAFRFFSWAQSEGMFLRNPLTGMKRPKPAPRERAMTLDEYDALYAASPIPFQRLLFSLRNTGARPKELRTLRWTQVREDRLILAEHKTKKKTGKPRIIYLNAAMRELLTQMRKEATDEHVFLNCKGRPWSRNAVRLQVSRLRKKLNLKEDVVAYLLRHTWGTQAILNGVDVTTVAECMGHTSLDMVSKVYVHLAEQHEHLTEAMEKAVPLSPPRTPPASENRAG